MSTRERFYDQVLTAEALNPRLELLLKRYREHTAGAGRPCHVLDVGSGEHAPMRLGIRPGDVYHATDLAPRPAVELEHYVPLDLQEDELLPAFGRTFDVIFCSEVIEHVFSPDRLLRQLRSVMHAGTLLLLSTPNLAYWANRILVPLGIAPLFVENSAEVVLGRRTRRLGQGNRTQGHVRVFTHRAVLDLVAREGFDVAAVQPVQVWPNPIDALVCRFSPNLAPDNVYSLRLRAG